MSSVSWVLLTYNRKDIVAKCFEHNRKTAGSKIDELVWVDNGSTDGVRDYMLSQNPDIAILHKENKGVAKGYNAGLLAARQEYIVITGCDMLMPSDWLKTFLDYVEKIPETGVASIYSRPYEDKPERLRGARRCENGLDIVPAMPIERRIFKRDLLKDFGYFHEGFGLYGWDDLHWAFRAEAVCKERDLLTYVIPDSIATHLGTEGIEVANGAEDPSYHSMKQKEVRDPRKQELLKALHQKGWPKFTPVP